MAKMLSDGDDKLLWIPDGGIDDIKAVTAAELTAPGVLDASCLVTKNNFALGPTGDQAINDPALCAPGNSSVPGFTDYEAAFDFFRGTTPEDDEGWTTFTNKGLFGYWAHRIGLPSDVAPAAAQSDWRIFGAITGTPMQQVPDSNGGFRKFRLPSMIQSELVNERVTLV